MAYRKLFSFILFLTLFTGCTKKEFLKFNYKLPSCPLENEDSFFIDKRVVRYRIGIGI